MCILLLLKNVSNILWRGLIACYSLQLKLKKHSISPTKKTKNQNIFFLNIYHQNLLESKINGLCR